jgi:hypothetical protein
MEARRTRPVPYDSRERTLDRPVKRLWNDRELQGLIYFYGVDNEYHSPVLMLRPYSLAVVGVTPGAQKFLTTVIVVMGLSQLMILYNLNEDLVPVIGFQPTRLLHSVFCTNQIAIFGKTRHKTPRSTDPTLVAVEVSTILTTIIK